MYQTAGAYEPALTLRFLPGCKHCHAPHPQALGLVLDNCQGCGEPVASPGRPRVERAVLSGLDPASLAARACFAVSRFLISLTKG